MKTIDEILQTKGNDIWTISPDATVYEAIKLMDSKKAGALAVVMDDNLVGIVSERDYARNVVLKDRTSRETKVKEIMTSQVVFTCPEQSASEGMALMNSRHIRHLPVLKDRKLVGMISINDVVKEIIDDQQYTIHQLEQNLNWEEQY
jgi:CBS domain-containing protein